MAMELCLLKAKFGEQEKELKWAKREADARERDLKVFFVNLSFNAVLLLLLAHCLHGLRCFHFCIPAFGLTIFDNTL